MDRTTDEADYAGLILPGGVANPDQLRTIPAAVQFVRSMFEAGKPAAVVCHGPWTLVEGDLVQGRTLTSWPSLKTDIRNAGAIGSTRKSMSVPMALTPWSPADSPTICRHSTGL